MILDLLVGSIYNPVGSCSTFAQYFSVSNTLTLNQTVLKNIRTRAMGSSISWTGLATVERTITNLSVGNVFALSQGTLPRAPILVNVLSGWMAWDHAINTKVESLVSPLLWTGVAVGERSTNLLSTLTWQQTVNAQLVRNPSVTSSYTPAGYATITTAAGAAFILAVAPVVVPQEHVTFTFGNFTFNVRSPDWDNSTKLEFSRISRRTRAGDLIIYRDSMWPESETLMMSFTFLLNRDKRNFEKLFNLSLGQLVRYDDYQGQSWAGIILNPQEPIVAYGLHRYSLKVELQGGRI